MPLRNMSVIMEPQQSALIFPELVFGLIGAVGTDSDKILETLDHALKQVKYRMVPSASLTVFAS